MNINFQSLANSPIRSLVPYQPGKPIEELEREQGITSSIKLASNENPLGPSPLAIQATQLALSQCHVYPDGSCYELKTALSDFLSVSRAQLTIGNGSENILELIVKSYLSQQDNAVISQYAFLTIPLLIQSCGANIHVVAARWFGHDVSGMLRAIDEKTRVLFFVNPNNPTGTYTNKDDFHRLMENVPPHVLIVVDEAYREYITQEDYPDTLSYLPKYPNLIITRTFSKAYGLAGLRLGYAISSIEIADILNRARLPFNVNLIAMKAGCAALKDTHHLDKTVALNHLGREQLTIELDKLKVKQISSMGNFITIEVDDAEKMYQQLLREGIIVRPLSAYHLPSHIRVTISTPLANERFLKTFYSLI